MELRKEDPAAAPSHMQQGGVLEEHCSLAVPGEGRVRGSHPPAADIVLEAGGKTGFQPGETGMMPRLPRLAGLKPAVDIAWAELDLCMFRPAQNLNTHSSGSGSKRNCISKKPLASLSCQQDDIAYPMATGTVAGLSSEK